MSEPDDIVDSWQFRTAMVGAVIAAVGVPVCLVGSHIGNKTLCGVGAPMMYVGDAVGIFGIAAVFLALGWDVMQGGRTPKR